MFAVVFLFCLVFLALIQLYAQRLSSPRLPAGGILISAITAPDAIRGVEGRRIARCPRQAQALLSARKGSRALTYREGSHWVVLYGSALRVDRVYGLADGNTVAVHYLRRTAPRLPASSPGRIGADPPSLDRFVVHRNAAVTGSVESVHRCTTPDDALVALGGGAGVVLYNGENDPTYYALRLSGAARVVTDDTLPGTVLVPKRSP